MINNVTLVGRLTRDPELKKTNTNKSVVSFTMACNRKYGEEQADFINCVAWEKTADYMANYLEKGSLVGIEGRIQSRSYEDATGKRIYVQEVVVERLQNLTSRSGNTNNEIQGTEEYVSDDEPALVINSDDLPF